MGVIPVIQKAGCGDKGSSDIDKDESLMNQPAHHGFRLKTRDTKGKTVYGSPRISSELLDCALPFISSKKLLEKVETFDATSVCSYNCNPIY